MRLENLLNQCPLGSVIDIKLGKNTFNPKASKEKIARHIDKSNKSTSCTLYFRISGMIVKDKNGNAIKKAKKSDLYLNIKEEEIPELISEILKSNESQTINSAALKKLIEFVESLIQFFSK